MIKKSTFWASLMILQCFVCTAHGDILIFSEPDFEWYSQGPSTQYHLWTTGDYWRQQFDNTGLESATDLSLDLVILHDLALGTQDMSFDVFVNGLTVGSFDLLAGVSGLYQYDFSFSPIAGNDYFIEMIATSSMVPGNGSYSIVLDNQSFATLTPAPTSLAVFALLGLVGIRRRRFT